MSFFAVLFLSVTADKQKLYIFFNQVINIFSRYVFPLSRKIPPQNLLKGSPFIIAISYFLNNIYNKNMLIMTTTKNYEI